MYIQTSGVDTPTRLFSPFILAQTARAMDINATMFFVGDGLTVVKKGEAENIQKGTFPVLRELIDQSMEAGVEFYVCDQSKRIFGWGETEFIDGVKIAGAATLNDMVLDCDGVMWF